MLRLDRLFYSGAVRMRIMSQNWALQARGPSLAVCHTKALLDKGTCIVDKGIIHTKVALNKGIVRN